MKLYPEKSFFILNLESVQLCPSPVLPHAISAQNCAEFEVKHKSNSSWTHSNPGTWKLVLILKWKTDWLVANISPTRTQLKSGTVCTVLLGTQFYAFQIQNQKRFFGKAAWGVTGLRRDCDKNFKVHFDFLIFTVGFAYYLVFFQLNFPDHFPLKLSKSPPPGLSTGIPRPQAALGPRSLPAFYR